MVVLEGREAINLAIAIRTKRPDEVVPFGVLRSQSVSQGEPRLGYSKLTRPSSAPSAATELQPIAYLERGAIAARTIARVDLGLDGAGMR